MVIFVVLHLVTREKEETLLLKWIDSLKKFGYIFNAVFFHVSPPGSLEFLYSLFLRRCCFYISFLQKPVGITAGPVAIIQCLIQGIFHHQSSQKTSRSQVCCWCCTFRLSLRCDSPASAPDPQPKAHALFSYFSISQTLKDCELRIWRKLVLLPSRAEVHGTLEPVSHFVMRNLPQGCTKALWHQQEAFWFPSVGLSRNLSAILSCLLAESSTA